MPPPEPRHNLPDQFTSFIGQRSKLAEIEQLLATSRLLSLVGVGGKTRLAPQVASNVLDDVASLARAQGNVEKGEGRLKYILLGYRDVLTDGETATILCYCGVLAVATGSYQRGTRLMGQATPQQARAWWLMPDDLQAYDAAIVTARSRLGEEGFATAWAEGQEMTLDQAVAYALHDEFRPAGTVAESPAT